MRNLKYFKFLTFSGYVSQNSRTATLADYQLADGLLGNVATLVVGVIVGAIACAIVLPAMKLFGKH